MPRDQLYASIPVKLYRTPDRVTVAAAMPGVEPEDISAEITGDGHLVLRARLRAALKGEKDVVLDEWDAGGTERTVALPALVDGPLANLTYGNGVLVVVLPVATELRPAALTLAPLGPARGERAGNAGHPVRPVDDAAHRRSGHEGR